IKQIQQKYKSTGVVISHDIKSCFNIGDHIILLHGGKVVDQGSKEELQQSRNPLPSSSSRAPSRARLAWNRWTPSVPGQPGIASASFWRWSCCWPSSPLASSTA